MSTDKTLADVQPGGMVRLGDQAERARFEKWLATQHDQGSEHVMAKVSDTDDRYQSPVTSSMWSAWQAANAAREGGRINGWRVIDGVRVYSAYAHASILDDQQYVRYEDYLAALSAQPSPGTCKEGLQVHPSPGGQGDARAIIEEFIQCATLGRPPGKLIAQAKDYLAVRQPVGQAFHVNAVEPCGKILYVHPAGVKVGDTLYAAPPAQAADSQPVGEPVDATDAMVEAALQSTVANNASPWRQVVASEDHADFISDMRAAINAALAARPSPITAEATTTSTQTVPDHCDRIFWQHNYYQLPVGPTDQKKPTRRRQAAVETLLNLGFLWRNGAWIAPPAQAVDLGPVRDVFRRWHANELNSTDAMLALVEALAVIDSQAVGNGN